MSSTTALTRPRNQLRLPNSVAFGLLVSIIALFLAASSAPTPLYSTYQREWGFTPITTTIVFGVYALAVLAALLTVGSLSDHVGRRPVLIAAALVQASAMVIFATADGVGELLLARIVQGLATGAAAGTVGAALVDLHRARGTLANGFAAPLGTGLGAIGAGLIVQYLPAPTRLVYLVLLGVFLLQAVGVALMHETVTPRPGALASLRVSFASPPVTRRPLLVAAPALIAVWSLAGFYASLGPALVRTRSGSTALLLGGLPLFALAAPGAITVLVLQKATARRTLMIGMTMLAVGVTTSLAGVAAGSTALFFVGTVAAGIGFGAGFQGSIRTVLPLAEAHQRAGLLSILYTVSYAALGLPAVIGGVLVVHAGGMIDTAYRYGAAVAVLALLALAGLVVSGRRPDGRELAVCPRASQLATQRG
jgi:MFS family permease